MVGLRAPWGTEGGVEQSVASLGPRLARDGWDVTVYCRPRYNPHGSTLVAGVQLRDSPTVYGRGVEAFVHSAVAIPRASVAHDVVHVHACGPALFAWMPQVAGRATVVTLHGRDWAREKWGPAARTLLRVGAEVGVRAPDVVITVSAELAEWARGRTDAPVRHIPNGVEPHAPQPWDATVFPELTPGRYALFVGRLVPEKGLEALVAAAGLGPLPVVVVGGAADTEAWAARLRREAPANVHFLGPRFGAEKDMLLTHAAGFVFPSRLEGMSIALLEALAAGLPTVVSDIGANREALGDVGGWRVPPDDPTALARALQALSDTPAETRARIGAEGRARVAARYSWDEVARATSRVYAAALERRRG